MVTSVMLDFATIKKEYPDEWVLVGDPELDNTFTGSVISKLKGGVVLYHSKDRREIAYHAQSVRVGYESVVCVYSGEIPQNRKYWL